MTVVPFDPHRFQSTAANYLAFRVPYPEELIDLVMRRLGLGEEDALLDLGCGPGQLGVAFARRGLDVTLMDPEAEMLGAARANAAQSGVEVTVIEGSSYDLTPRLGRFRVVTMGRSFHWMDRPATLAMLDRMVEPDGAVALFHDRQIRRAPDWKPLLDDLSRTLSPERMAGRDERHGPGWEPHEAILLRSAFSRVERIGYVWERVIGIDDIVGRAFSLSVTSPEALGDKAGAFEERLRAGLAELAPDGVFRELVEADALVALRP